MSRMSLAPIDTDALKARVDLIDLIGHDTRLTKIAGTRGGEYAGPCPSCGGDDRLRVQPEKGLWYCRGCRERWSDAIAYVQWRNNVGFIDAVRMLGGTVPLGVASRHATISPPKPPEPSDAWSQRAAEVVVWATDNLWSQTGERARAYLHGRGLTDATIGAFSLGYIPRNQFDRPATWGFSDDDKAVSLRRGIVIPWIVAGNRVWNVKIRRPEADPKYVAARGSIPTIFGTQQLRGLPALVLVEGEFDAMLLWQEAGDVADVATLGSAGKALDPRAALYLLGASRILVAYDGDSAGATGAEKLIASSRRMRRLELPEGQDITDYHQAGGDLRQLVTEAMRTA